MIKCLVVDDVQVTRFATDDFLKDHGVEVLAAENGGDALNILKSGGVDVVILDWHLGREDGIEVLKKIRDKFGKKLPIIMLSGVESEKRAAEAINAGANSFLEKPTTQEKLVQCIKGLGLKLT